MRGFFQKQFLSVIFLQSCSLCFSLSVHAKSTEKVLSSNYNGIYEGQSLRQRSLEEILSTVKPNTVILLGENHGVLEHKNQHLQILNQLRHQGLKVSVGLEFLDYRNQKEVDLYRQGYLKESDFLNQVQWGGVSFDFYREQLQFPKYEQGEFSLALNLSRQVTNKVMRHGLLSLSPEESSWLPPQFELGREIYKKRFTESIPHKIPEDKLINWFTAHCLWDDTVAWTISDFMKNNPDQVLVVVMGDFHIQYGGGLPDRLQKRWGGVQMSLSQLNSWGAKDKEIEEILKPHPEYGPRADYIWVAEAPEEVESPFEVFFKLLMNE
ncbi:MAG TPA: ChaN family lipoprotein [Pseudobdellovibrionaceae bacterium]|nr:ChaN family lipoprotein [Pseudobdellovibrionaceae bacterium]